MQIEEGKWYRRRDGKIVGPAKVSAFPTYSWSVNSLLYTDEGFYLYTKKVSYFDLVEEVKPPRSCFSCEGGENGCPVCLGSVDDDDDDPEEGGGGSSSYYQLPEGATELLDLIEGKDMPYARANIFKACYRLGEKEGTDVLYDLRKIKFFADRMLRAYKEERRV
jgi:hypothetical protein